MTSFMNDTINSVTEYVSTSYAFLLDNGLSTRITVLVLYLIVGLGLFLCFSILNPDRPESNQRTNTHYYPREKKQDDEREFATEETRYAKQTTENDKNIHDEISNAMRKTGKDSALRKRNHAWKSDSVKDIENDPADCAEAVRVLQQTNPSLEETKHALLDIQNRIMLCESKDLRGKNKLAQLCNCILKHQGLEAVQKYEQCKDRTVRELSSRILEKVVPTIWH